MGEFAVGQGVPRFEDPRLIQGGGRYVDDVVLPGMAFGCVLRSPHAHAKIKSIDVTAAKAAPGVLAVITGADWAASGFGDLPVPGAWRGRGGPTRGGGPRGYGPASPALVKDRGRWVGDYVASGGAGPRAQGRAAVELITVEYEPLPAVVSTAEAIAPGAPRVFD